MRARRVLLALTIGWPLACSSTQAGYQPSGGGGGDDAGSTGSDDATAPADAGNDAPSFGDGGSGPPDAGSITSLVITPAMGTLVTMDGGPGTQQFQVQGKSASGALVSLSGPAKWSRDNIALGDIDANGLFSAKGTLGGVVNVTARYGSLSATVPLTVKIHYLQNPGNVPSNVQQALAGATTADASVKWAYPYDQTVFPRGINESTLMWLGGKVTDAYYVHVTAPTFELESYALAPNQWFDFTTTGWTQFLDSTSGPAEVKVTRWDGMQASILVDEHWIIANGSMRGTVYYAAYQVVQGVETGKVLRIKPGAVVYDDFIDAGTKPNCPSCHTVSANGSTLVLNEGNWPQFGTIAMSSVSYDLNANANVFFGLTTDAGASAWAIPGVSADGKTLVESFAPVYGDASAQTGAFDTTSGATLTGTGLEGKPLWMPAFAPDDKLLAYVDATTHDLHAVDWDATANQASNDRILVASAANAASPQIQYPTVSPDHMWVVYQRGPSLGSLGVPGDLYAASVASPGTEIPLDAVNGTGYPFAEGSRDLHLDYEPTFAPVAAGGFFWLVFHSRRTYGNKLTETAYVQQGVGVKQLWVAAFDQTPKSGTDPSHPAFYLGGQNPDALNTRGYWALEPCKAAGQACQSGTECCGGYCDTPPDGGPPVCEMAPSGGCSQNGDKCTTTADCCNAASGVTCINSVCSEAPPPGSQ